MKLTFFAKMFCKHPKWVKFPEGNVLYAAGEEGSFAYKCATCGRVALVDQDRPPDETNPIEE